MSSPVSLASSIFQTTTTCADDTTPPATLGVTLARFGELTDATVSSYSAVRVDPLVLMLDRVEPGCRLELLNLSKNPEASWSRADDVTALPGDTLRSLTDGRYGLVLGDAAAKKLDIAPGDVFELRQVDDAGNASTPTRVALNQNGGPERWAPLVNYGQLDRIDADAVPIGVPVDYRAYGDRRAPVVLTKNLRIEAESLDGATLSGLKGTEPGATVMVQNMATLKTFSATVDADGKLSLPFEAKVGHPLHLWVTDTNGATTDLGVTKYKPACAKAGLCNSASLLAQL